MFTVHDTQFRPECDTLAVTFDNRYNAWCAMVDYTFQYGRRWELRDSVSGKILDYAEKLADNAIRVNW
jgi:hypothetical protein